MGFILGPVLEYGQTVTLGQGNIVAYIATERPIALAILVATPVITYLMWRRSVRLRRALDEGL